MKRIVILCVNLFLLASCTSGGSIDNSDSSGKLEMVATDGVSDSSGTVSFPITIPSGASAVQFMAEASGVELQLTSARGAGVDLLSSSVSERSDATSRQVEVSSFNAPTLQGGIPSGDYTLSYKITRDGGDEVASGVSVRLTRVTKRDGDLSSGVVRVNMITVGPLAGSVPALNDLEEALQIAREMFQTVSLDLDVQWYGFEGGTQIPNPAIGSSFYETLSNNVRQNAVNVVIGTEVSSRTSSSKEIGVAGSIPGAILPSPKSAVAFGMLEVGGGDGRLDYDGEDSSRLFDDERRVAGEVMAQLIAKYLGLRPVVEFKGGLVSQSDRLADTVSCLTTADCENEKQPRHNLMYPYVVRIQGDDKEVYPRNYISPQQGALLQRSVLVD